MSWTCVLGWFRFTVPSATVQEVIMLLGGDWIHFAWGELPFGELMIYTLRHVQEHGAQLRMFLGQNVKRSSGRVSRAE